MYRTAIVVLLLQISLAICKPSPADIDRIFFRNSLPYINAPNPVCVSTLCNNTSDYDERSIRNAVVKDSKFHYLFGPVVDKQMKIEDRFGGEDTTTNMCPTKTVTMYPRQGRNIYQELKTIVNVKNYHQMVSYEECVPDTECYVSEQYLPLGVKSHCENNYIIIRLVVINDDRSLSLEKFSVPSGCSCTYSTTNYYK